MKKRFLSMLVLLASVVSGAWAQTTINVTADDLGKAVCTDGSIYEDVYKAQSAGKTAAAKIICLDTQNSKALALSLDNQAVAPGTVDYATAQSRCEALNTTLAVTFGTWVLPSKAQWEAMIEAAGYKKLRDGIGTLFGGKKMEAVVYWSSTAGTTGHWRFHFNEGNWEDDTYNSSARACLVINLPQTYSVTLAEGTEDADKWTISDGTNSAKGNVGLTGLTGDGTETVTITYTGEKRVKSVKAVKKAATTPVTAITLNKTATSIEVGSTETLSVTAVAPDNATDKTYTWKTSDASKATVDQDGKVTAVAAGTVTIYAEANDGSGVKGNCTVTVTPATITVTINLSDWGWESLTNGSFTKGGVTVSAGDIDPINGNLMNNVTFSTTLGKFTKIVVTAKDINFFGTDWSGNSSSMTWAGTPASTVSFSGHINGHGQTQTTIVCTIVPTN